MIRTSCLVLALMAAFCAAQGPPSTTTAKPRPRATYWLMCSRNIRPGQDYVCMAQILDGTSPVSVTLTLRDYYGKSVLTESDPILVYPGGPQNISIPITYFLASPGRQSWQRSYRATFKGVGQEVNFEEQTTVQLEEKAVSVFIQTDKAIYKFGQRVQFRVLVTTMDLKPVTKEPVDIIIEDPKRNRIWQRLGVTDLNGYGVLDDLALQLADRALKGMWTIKVSVLGTEQTKEFEVDDYVLPKIEVEIQAPKFGVDYHSILEITVKATYTFGQPVTDGLAVVRLGNRYSYYQKDRAVIENGKLDSHGEFKVNISRDQLLYVRSRYNSQSSSLEWSTFKIEANVTEGNTLRTRGAEHTIQYRKTPLKMTFMPITPKNFKPGLDYTGFLELRRWDDTIFPPSEMTDIKVRFSVEYGVPAQPTTTTTTTTTMAPLTTSSGSPTLPKLVPEDIMYPDFGWPRRLPDDELELTLNEPVKQAPVTGWIPITFRVPDDAKWFRIRATCEYPYKEVEESMFVSKSNSPTDSYLQLSVPTDRPKVGDVLRVKANSTTPVSELFYQVYTKGKMVIANSLKPDSPRKDLEFSVTLEQRMAPSVRIVVFYLREDNSEFVVDALSLNVDGIFQKPVSVQFSKDTVKPGEDVDVILQAEADSLVFLLSNDKSVQLLRSGNDITQDVVRQDLMEYDYGGGYQPWMRYMFFCGWPSYYGGNDASSVFSSAEVLVLTDSSVYSWHDYNYDDYSDYPIPPAGTMGPAPPPGTMAPAPPPSGGPTETESFKGAETVRKFFPENFLWKTKLIGENGFSVIKTQAPDTITSWITTAFSMHKVYGLGVAEKPAELVTYRELFVTLDLPLGITQGEDYCFTATVFSYHASPLPVLLTLERSSDFDFIHLKRNGATVQMQKKQGRYSFFMGDLEQNDSESAMFCISPKKVGKIMLQVSALTMDPKLSDAVKREIKVKPEGVPRVNSKPFLVDLSGPGGVWSKDVPISFPEKTVADSQHVTVAVAGNVLGPVLENLDDLLRMPYGCGEQNMLNFAPTVFLTDFYFKTNTNDSEKIQKSKEYMLKGYTKELRYEHGKTGTYSTFGDSEGSKENGSLWLTAFVTKTFAQGEQLNAYQEVFPLDHNVLERSVDWMSRQANGNGEFIEYGKVFNKRMQGGSAKGEALTAYTMLAMFEAKEVFTGPDDTRMQNVISAALRKGSSYLEGELPYISDPYDACIVGYALHKQNSVKKDEAFNLIERLATTEDGTRYWKRPNPEPKHRSYWWSRGVDAINIEATAYCLLVYSERGIATSAGLPVMRWITNQRGPNGGFISTQDTVIGLEALTRVSAELYSTEDIPMTITVSYDDVNGITQSNSVFIDKSRELLLQKIHIPYKNGAPSMVNIRAETNSGLPKDTTVMAEVITDYNVDSEATTPTYETSHQMLFLENGIELQINIKSTSGNASMTTLRVEIPPGYDVDLELLEYNRYLSKFDMDYKNGQDLIIYFDTNVITTEGVHVVIALNAKGSGALISPKDKSYTITNYYEPSEEVSVMYSVDQKKGICQIVKSFSFCNYIRWE